MTIDKYKAFTHVEKIEDGGLFPSSEIKNFIRKGVEAAKEHKFLVADAPAGVGASVALNALKASLLKDSKVLAVELTPYPFTTQQNVTRLLFADVLMKLGELPVYRWLDYVTIKGKKRRGRHSQMKSALNRLYAEGKSVLLLMDNALSQQRYLWQLLYNLAGLTDNGQHYGPGALLVANLTDKVARFKPEEIVEEGKPEFPNLARRVSFKLSGLTTAEVDPYIRFQAARDGAAFTNQFKADLLSQLANDYLVACGKHRFPGTINAVGRNLMEEYYKLGKDIYVSAVKLSKREARSLAGVES